MAVVNVDILKFYEGHRDICRDARANGDVIELNYPENDLGMYVVSTHRGVNEVLKNDLISYQPQSPLPIVLYMHTV